ncbi:iron ABC transporter permease [Fervidobacterium sp. 2310opik-2]|uniref:ABC transporter permease n=1 Tax=Fervidobacterium sp. 2310opik-2 TaxID=1755815 RepID=UPI0013DEDE2E|nr:iron ABC transporter permease [Fervidobacterium sp. 2310opik-2]KAF2962223.1 ABC transporter permease [Fervidobacterium sp. 2310opik-2]
MEQRNWKIIKFLAVITIVFTILFWIRTTIKNEFSRMERENLLKLANSISMTDSEKIKENYQDLEYYVYDFEGNYEESLEGLNNTIKNLPDFSYGEEHALYEEIYISPKIITINNKKYFVVFSPIVKDYEVVAIMVQLHNAEDTIKLLNTIDIMFLIALTIFVIGFAIGIFSTDPVTTYAIIITFVVVLVFIVYPLYEAVKLTFTRTGTFTFNVWKTILTEKNYLKAFFNSILLGTLTATVSTIIGFLFAFLVTRTSIKGKKFISTMATLPVISPPFSLTLSIILLFGSNGLITKQLLKMNWDIYGLDGLVIAQTMGMFPIAYLTMVGVLESIDSTLEEAAMNLGASRWKIFSTITLPLSLPGLLSSWLLVFTNSVADFANPLMLGGKFNVLSVTAYLEVTGMNRLDRGAALSLLLLLPTLTAFYLQRYVVNRKSYVTVTGKPSGRIVEIVSPKTKIFLTTLVYIIVFFLIGLYSTIFMGCFVKNWGIDYTFTTANIKEALQRGKDALVDTTILASVAMPIAGIFSMIVAFLFVRKKFPGKKILQGLVLLPFSIPGTLIGISYVIAFNKPPIILVGTAAIIVINYIIRELPVGVEGGVATLKQIDPSIEEAAQNLGANPQTVFSTIILPLIRPAFISSLSYTFVRSMTAVSAVVFLISAKWYHITMQIYNFSENLRFGLASVLSSVLIIIILTVFGLLRILVKKSEYLEKTIVQ